MTTTTTPLLPHLAGVAKKTRLQADAQHYNIAHEAGVNPTTVERFEKLKGGWPTKLDDIIRGYAIVAGSAPVDIWQAALDEWTSAPAATHGPMPTAPPGVLGHAVQGDPPTQPTDDRTRHPNPSRRRRTA